MKKILLPILVLGFAVQSRGQQTFDLSFEKSRIEITRSKDEDKIIELVIKAKNVKPEIWKGYTISILADKDESTLAVREYVLNPESIGLRTLLPTTAVYLKIKKDTIQDRQRKLVLNIVAKDSSNRLVNDKNTGDYKSIEIIINPAIAINTEESVKNKKTDDIGVFKEITIEGEKEKKEKSNVKANDKELEKIKEAVRAVINETNDSKVKIGALHLKRHAITFDAGLLKEDVKLDNINNKDLKDFIKEIDSSYEEHKSGIIVSYVVRGKKFESEVIKLDSVKVDIREGMIEYLKVYSNGNTFYNKRAPIAIVHIDKRQNDKLYNENDDKFIFLKNVIVFETDNRFGFLPSDETFSMKNKNDIIGSKELYANNGINSLVNFSSYTDLLALLANQANAIVHLEANAKFYLHRKNVCNCFMYIFSSLEPYFHFNKIDSQFDTIRVEGENINRVSIFRRHTYAVGIDLSVFRWDWKPSNSLEVKAGYMYTSTNIEIDSSSTQGILHSYYIDVGVRSKVVHNFGVDVNIRCINQSLNENPYFDADKNNFMVSIRGGIFYASPKNGQDKIFLRFTNYLNFPDRRDDFSQLQLGFTKALKL